MPVMKGRHKHIKVYRPAGTLVSHARLMRPGNDSGISTAVKNAFVEAADNFKEEFGRSLDLDRTVVEIVFDTTSISAAVIEIPEEEEDE